MDHNCTQNWRKKLALGQVCCIANAQSGWDHHFILKGEAWDMIINSAETSHSTHKGWIVTALVKRQGVVVIISVCVWGGGGGGGG